MRGRAIKEAKALIKRIAPMSFKKALLALGAFCAIVVVAFETFELDILEGEVSNITKIVVTYEPCLADPLITNIEDKTDIQKMYRLIKTTHDRETVRYPGHSESMQTDSRFWIDVEYNNGAIERISSSENPTCIYRKLDTRGYSGDPGFVSGSNEMLWDYIKMLFCIDDELTYLKNRWERQEKKEANRILALQYEIVRKFVADRGYKTFLNSEANAIIWLPTSFSDNWKEFPIGERVRQMNELSKQNGYDFSRYLGNKVALFTCSTEENGNEGVHLNIIMDKEKIVGFWSDKHTNPPDFNLLLRNLTE